MRLLSCVVLVAALGVTACGGEDGDGGGVANLIPTSPTSSVAYSATDLRPGTGTEATTGRVVSVRYTGWLYAPTAADNKGTQFDSGTFNFTVGTGVIPGFSMGVNGMRVGGIRRVVIPPNLGYGSTGSGIIRPNETLLFEIELLAVQ